MRIWGLQQGILGRNQKALAPSLTAMGENRYLQPRDFAKTLAVALLIHLTVFGIVHLLSEEKITDIPVRSLSFKLGGTRIAMRQPAPAPAPTTPAASTHNAVQQTSPSPKIAAQQKPSAPPKESHHQRPRDTPRILPTQTVQQPIPTTTLPDPRILTQPAAIAPSPQRFVRETLAAPNANPTTQEQEKIRAGYESSISHWIYQHKVYPPEANGQEGRVVIRLRIDRTGMVRYYALEESSRNLVLDAAAIDMIRRANPMPAVPENYPAGALIEFLIPINFRAPQ